MVGKNKKIGIVITCLVGLSAFLFARPAQNEEENYVRLVKAQSVNLITDEDGKSLRKAVEATFLHNGTLLICDTAYWRVDDNIINALGHVCLTQEGTELTSDKLDYFVDKNLAQFRGSLVQLRDKENNILRTHYLDYNTADSVAVFFNGASMKDKDGQIIESIDGSYRSKEKLFLFEKSVNMFTDSVFIKTRSLDYHTDSQRADFNSYIDFWKDDNMLSAAGGWYDRGHEKFFFSKDVHATTPDHEAWCDTLIFYKNENNVLMRGDVQLQDSVRNTTAVSRYLFYEDSLSTVTLRKEAAVAIITEDNLAQKDTLYFGADTLVYYSMRYCDIPKSELANSASRRSEIMTDPVGEYRKKAAQAAAQAAEEAKKKAAGTRPGLKPQNTIADSIPAPLSKLADTTSVPITAKDTLSEPSFVADSLSTETIADSTVTEVFADSLALTPKDTTITELSSPTDSLTIEGELPALDSVKLEVVDTTKYGFAFAQGNVKIFRKDIQVRCDSMRYADLDSIARFYKNPIVWNEENRQYYSDSLSVLIKNGHADRASLTSNAFVINQDDSLHFDQIRSSEIMAFFDSTSALKRFDALGDALAVFFLRENDHLSTVNKVESKMLSGNFVNGTIDRIYYYDSPKNDAYPIVQFPEEERILKGFKWSPEQRPKGKADITSLTIRRSQRHEYESRPRTEFKQTDKYFPGYIKSVYASIEADKKAKERARLEKERAQKSFSEMTNPIDSTSSVKDSLATIVDSSQVAVSDSVVTMSDSLAVSEVKDTVASPVKKTFFQKIKDKFAQWREARERRWAQLDERDAKREAQKKEKALQKKREKTRKELIERQKQQKREKEILDRYIEYYEKQKSKEDGKDSR